MKLIITLFLAFAFIHANAQEKANIYISKFIPRTVTYNASPNPNQCWEAVSNGLEIKTGKTTQFFTLNWKVMGDLKKKIGDAEVMIEVEYYKEAEEGSGAVGTVVKISLDDVVLFDMTDEK